MDNQEEPKKVDDQIEESQVVEERQVELDPEKVTVFEAQMEMQQNFLLAIVGGAISAIVGAAIWAGITVATEYQIGWMAIGVGLLVGFTVRFLGKGISIPYGVVGAVFALLGCLFGNLLSVCGFVSIQDSVPFMQVVGSLLRQPLVAIDILKETFNPMDVLFYGIAIYEGYKFSFRQIQEEELATLLKEL